MLLENRRALRGPPPTLPGGVFPKDSETFLWRVVIGGQLIRGIQESSAAAPVMELPRQQKTGF
jgi:hypothetical protein